MTITGYWVLNMIDKIVYPDVPALLEAKCPVIYGNYLKMIKGDKKDPIQTKILVLVEKQLIKLKRNI